MHPPYKKIPIRLDHGGNVLLSLCELTPMERWQGYGVFPTKVVLHVILLVLTTAAVLHDAARWSPYRLASQASACHFFAPAPCAAKMCGASPTVSYGWDNWSNCFIFSTDELYAAVRGVVYNYYHIEDIALANYGVMRMAAGEVDDSAGTWAINVDGRNAPRRTNHSEKLIPLPPLLTATLQSSTNDSEHQYHRQYPLTLADLGPLDTRKNTPAAVEDFVARLLTLAIDLELTDELAEDGANVCYLWHVRVLYDIRNKVEIAVSQKTYIRAFCDALPRKGGDQPGRMDGNRQVSQARRLIQGTQTFLGESLGSDGGRRQALFPFIHPLWTSTVHVDRQAYVLSAGILGISLWLVVSLLCELYGSCCILRRARALVGMGRRVSYQGLLPPGRTRSTDSLASLGSRSTAWKRGLDWDRDVHLSTKFHFVSFWQLLLLTGTLVSGIESLCALRHVGPLAPPMVTDVHAAWRGLGAACLWVYACRYMHHSDR